MINEPFPVEKKRGRPPRYLLSSIAVCGVCGASTRIGTQNSRAHASGSHYRVYECAGRPGNTGFHVSIRQEHLEEMVIDAVIARVVGKDFVSPRKRPDDQQGTERRALRLELKGHRVWLDAVRAEAEKREQPELLRRQEELVFPMIEAATAKLEELEELDPLVRFLRRAHSARDRWEELALPQQRHIVSTLLIPKIYPITADERGLRGPNHDRVELIWRTHSQ